MPDNEVEVSDIKDVSEVNNELEQISLISELMSHNSIREIEEQMPAAIKKINPLTFNDFIAQVELKDRNKASQIRQILQVSYTDNSPDKASQRANTPNNHINNYQNNASSKDEFYKQIGMQASSTLGNYGLFALMQMRQGINLNK